MALFAEEKKKPEKLDRRRSLAGVPVINDNVTTEDLDDGSLALSVQIPRGDGFLDRFRPPVMKRRVKLDELGSFVVRQMDGKKAVADLIGAFMAKYKTNRRETELSIVEFIKSLVKRQAISILID